MFGFENADLLILGIGIASIGVLSFVVFYNQPRSISSRSLLLFSIITIFWGISNYLNYQFSSLTSQVLVLWVLRIHLFLSVFHALSFFILVYVFPREHKTLSRRVKILIPIVLLVALVTLTPLAFSSIKEFTPAGTPAVATTGPGMLLFAVAVFGLVGSGLILLFRKLMRAKGDEKVQLRFIFIGAVITFILLLTFQVILTNVFEITSFLPLGAVYILPFIGLTAYAVLKHNLFNVKVIATDILAFAIVIFTFFEVLISQTVGQRIFRSIIFALLLVVSILLIRSVRNEVRQRVLLAEANVKLRQLDQAKSDFISIASHQLRTPMTVIKGYISMLLEGSFGKVPAREIDPLKRVFESNSRLINLIESLLNISRIESGKLKYEFEKKDFVSIVDSVVDELKAKAREKGLDFRWQKPVIVIPEVTIDEEKIRQVLLNLIDNSIKYTPQGSIEAMVTKDKENVIFSVKDTGLGLTEDERVSLFNKFVRGKRKVLEFTGGTGLGLYVGRMMVEVHGGKIWAKSSGKDKGSTFAFSLPIKAGTLPKLPKESKVLEGEEVKH